MKSLVVLLVVANAAFYAFAAGYFDPSRAADAARAGQQVKPEALKIISIGEDGAPAAAVVPPPAPARAVAAEAVPPVLPVPAPDERICLRWQLPAGDAERLVQLLSTQFPEFALEREKSAAESGGWWVFIPMRLEKAEVLRKRDELNRHRIRDHFIIEGNERFVISLGVYAQEKAAKNFLATLKEKGIDGARLEQRPSKEGMVRVDASGNADMREKVTDAVRRLLPDAKPRNCQ